MLPHVQLAPFVIDRPYVNGTCLITQYHRHTSASAHTHSTTWVHATVQQIRSCSVEKRNDNKHFLFNCGVEVNIVMQNCLTKRRNYTASRHVFHNICGMSPILSVILRYLMSGIYDCARDIQWWFPPPCSMADTMCNGQMWWPYFMSRRRCIVSSQDKMASRKSQVQMRLPQRRPLAKTGWIAMVWPDQWSYIAWNRGSKWTMQSSTIHRRVGKSSPQPTCHDWSSTSSRLGNTFRAWSYRPTEMSTTTQFGLIRTSSITISVQGLRPLTLMIMQTVQR